MRLGTYQVVCITKLCELPVGEPADLGGVLFSRHFRYQAN
jgi:hypothetical protein